MSASETEAMQDLYEDMNAYILHRAAIDNSTAPKPFLNYHVQRQQLLIQQNGGTHTRGGVQLSMRKITNNYIVQHKQSTEPTMTIHNTLHLLPP